LHLWMDRGIGILQLVLCSAMGTRSLHPSNLTPGPRLSGGLFPAHAARVILRHARTVVITRRPLARVLCYD
jgi:hypothetical protein